MNQDLSSESWTKFEISQVYDNGPEIYYRIKQNGNIVLNVENTTPTTFDQMELWAADPFHGQKSNILMKNLKYEIFATGKYYIFYDEHLY